METTINGATYQIRKLTPFQQFHVARRLAPALWALSSVAEGASAGKVVEGMLSAFQPVAEILSKMSDQDSEYVLSTCLSAVYRQQGNNWAMVSPTSAGMMMFDDITLPVMIQLTFEVIKENMGNFFVELPGSLAQAPSLAG